MLAGLWLLVHPHIVLGGWMYLHDPKCAEVADSRRAWVVQGYCLPDEAGTTYVDCRAGTVGLNVDAYLSATAYSYEPATDMIEVVEDHSPWRTKINLLQCTDGDCWYKYMGMAIPKAGICKASTDEDDGCPYEFGVGDPIHVGSGNMYGREVDFPSSRPNGVAIIRHFNSQSLETGMFGVNWRSLYDARVMNVDPSRKKIIMANGQARYYLYVGEEWVAERLDDPNIFVSSASTGGWTYTRLAEQLVETFDSLGYLASITDISGRTQTIIRNSEGRMTSVMGPYGDSLSFTHNTNRFVSGFTTMDGDTYTYDYDISDRLISINYPNVGGTRTYHYEDPNYPNAMTGITDTNGERYTAWHYDAEGRATSSEHNNGVEKTTVDYSFIEDLVDPRTMATNALGKKTTYHLTTVNGMQRITQVEGHPSANCAAANKNYSYDANGFVASKTDWQGSTTTYVRNAKGQELSRTEASGSAEARTIATEWHPTFNLRTKVTEPDRETVYSYDASGNLLSQQTNDLTTP